MTKRTPYRVTVRWIATGCDYTCTLYLKNRADAFDAMARRIRLMHGIAREHLRFIDVHDAPEEAAR